MSTGLKTWISTEWGNLRYRLGYLPTTEPTLDLILKEKDECTIQPPDEVVDFECFDTEGDEGLRLPYESRSVVDATGNLRDALDVPVDCFHSLLELESYQYKVVQATFIQAKQLDAKQKLLRRIENEEKRYKKALNTFIQRRNELQDLNN